MSTFTIDSTRFGALELDAESVLEFPVGLIGLGGHRFVIVGDDGAFKWLHSADDPALALPVVDPWHFFTDYEVELSDDDTARVGDDTPTVWVPVRTGPALTDFSANLKAPIIVVGGRGHQVINESANAPVRAPLFPTATAAAA